MSSEDIHLQRFRLKLEITNLYTHWQKVSIKIIKKDFPPLQKQVFFSITFINIYIYLLLLKIMNRV